MGAVIELTQGKVALVDSVDFEWLKQFKWFANKGGYAVRSVKNPGGTVLMHREIMVAPKGFSVDHINGNPSDNRRANLRICNQSQNGANSRVRKNNTSGVPGVSWEKRFKLWRAYIMINRKQVFVGHYKDLNVAKEAREQKARELFGEFARMHNV